MPCGYELTDCIPWKPLVTFVTLIAPARNSWQGFKKTRMIHLCSGALARQS
ncbi:MAG: hypothetical protein JWL62_1134 [Hyphomicrobiales bacterium]|nr:hypothetical protein [Hyphomicrobiales bacterium]